MGTSMFNLLNPSLVRLIPLTLLAVASPRFESLLSSNRTLDSAGLEDDPPNQLAKLSDFVEPLSPPPPPPPLPMPPESPFNSSSNLSSSPKSTEVFAEELFFLSFMSNSIPGPKLTEGGTRRSLSSKRMFTGSKSLNPISISISMYTGSNMV